MDGRCQPQQLEEIGTDLAGLALGGDYVYWLTKPQLATGETTGFGLAEVHRCATSGCGMQPSLFASGFTSSLDDGINLAVVADQRDVYWTGVKPSGKLIHTCPASGCPTVGPTVKDVIGASSFSLTNTNFVWRDVGRYTNGIKVWSRGGDSTVTVATDQEKGVNVVADDEDVLWNQNQTIFRCPIGTECGEFGAFKLYAGFVGSSQITQMALVDGELYWSTWQPDGAAVMACNKRNCSQPRVVRGALGVSHAAKFFVQKSRLFVGTYPTASTPGELSTCELPSCKSVQKLASYSKPIFQLTGDAKRLFWISDQKVMKLVLP